MYFKCYLSNRHSCLNCTHLANRTNHVEFKIIKIYSMKLMSQMENVKLHTLTNDCVRKFQASA